jgi:hypothetical protein
VIIPDRVNARWIATLSNEQLVSADAELHATFREYETVEKRRTGSRYVLLQGPTTLVNAWLRWTMVNNETRTRGLVVRHQR